MINNNDQLFVGRFRKNLRQGFPLSQREQEMESMRASVAYGGIKA